MLASLAVLYALGLRDISLLLAGGFVIGIPATWFSNQWLPLGTRICRPEDIPPGDSLSLPASIDRGPAVKPAGLVAAGIRQARAFKAFVLSDFKQSRKRLRWVHALLLLPVLLSLCVPWVYKQVWYVDHWSGVPFMGKVIPVPRGMVGPWKSAWATKSICFLYFPAVFTWQSNHLSWSMTFGPSPVPSEKSLNAVKQLGINLSKLADGLGTSVGPASAVPTQEGKGWCYTLAADRGHVISGCVLFNADWGAMYDGPRNHLKDFFKVIAGIHDAKK